MYWGWITKSLALLLAILLCALFALFIYFVQAGRAETRVVFLSVGQGDAILITQGSHQIVIDGGRDGSRLLAHLGRHMPFYDRTIEILIPTHPDADHIGGLPRLLERYRVRTIFDTGLRSNTEMSALLARTMQEEGATMLPAVRGSEVVLPRGGELEILFPFTPLPETLEETNEGSVVARFEYGETSFLFPGDLPNEETYLSTVEPADILKAAHHGSRTSTSDTWLDLVEPETAIISVGNNSYGHPHTEVMERLSRRNIEALRTDELGDIVYRCTDTLAACAR